jgi:hypothetical protein
VKLDGKLELPQTDECGGSTRDVRDAAHDAGDLPTEQLLLVQQRLRGIKIADASSGWISFSLHLGTIVKEEVIPP